jgi:hypothetical protein
MPRCLPLSLAQPLSLIRLKPGQLSFPDHELLPRKARTFADRLSFSEIRHSQMGIGSPVTHVNNYSKKTKVTAVNDHYSRLHDIYQTSHKRPKSASSQIQ